MKKYDAYKDSGVKWIGEIPNHWEAIKISRVHPIIGSGTTPLSSREDYYSEKGLNWLQTGDLNNGDTIKYTVQKWLTPRGNWINEKGVTPTKEVKLELKENETLTEDNDNQLKAAIELASK